MKKIALVFLVAVLAPSLMLAWLAVRSLRDQQLVLERQQFLLYQGVADALAKSADDFTADCQHQFGQQVETMLTDGQAANISHTFDDLLRSNWPYAGVGFVVTMNGVVTCPTPASGPAGAVFIADNGGFLGNRETADVYWLSLQQSQQTKDAIEQAFRSPFSSVTRNSSGIASTNDASPIQVIANNPAYNSSAQNLSASNIAVEGNNSLRSSSLLKASQVPSNYRNVVPQQVSTAEAQNISKVAPAETEFRQLVGDATDGTIARFVDNKLNVLLWHRSLRETNLIFGAQLSLPRIKAKLGEIVAALDPAMRDDIAVALLDDAAKPVAVSRSDFVANWRHPFAATELDEALPHWEMAVYLLNPAKLAQSAHTLELTLGLLIAVLLLAIFVGGWLIVADLNRQLTLARQKTDFVSNVSHELKTPLTSIRMFSELLAEDRVVDGDKRRSYLQIIAAEASRLTRLINNVLDFSRMERGEKKYQARPFDAAGLVREITATYRPHLEALGFKLDATIPDGDITVNGDRDALSQVLVNLLSNAEKYSAGAKEIKVQVDQIDTPVPRLEITVLDRGPGVPRGCEEKIFEQFYRAHDSLSSGIQGSGLGLTLARQIARAHGGDVIYRQREGGGSCFTLSLPFEPKTSATAS